MNLPGYLPAQREWERRLPDPEGPCHCAECDGRGFAPLTDTDELCANCGGTGWIDEHGDPCESPEDQAARRAEHDDDMRKAEREERAFR